MSGDIEKLIEWADGLVSTIEESALVERASTELGVLQALAQRAHTSEGRES